MSIFDNMDPGQIAEAIDRQFGAGTAQGVMGAQGSQEQPPVIPQPPSMGGGQSDMSGFAGAGLTPPPIPPMQGMPSIPNMSQPGQALASQQPQGFQPIPGMPRPGLADAPYNSQPNQNPDPMQQIMGIMAMAGDPHRYKRENTAPQQGALMQYLQSLGV